MPDEIDHANETADLLLKSSLARRSRETKLVPNGRCHCESCSLDFDRADPDYDKKLFCDATCAAEYTREKSLRG